MKGGHWTTRLLVTTMIICEFEIFCDPIVTSTTPKETNDVSSCSMEFVMNTCQPYKTFQTCRNGQCMCPVLVPVPLLQDNLTIDTYWEPRFQQCVSKLNSVCFYLPPSVQVSQPYRCVIPNSECVQGPGQFRGIGVCQCRENYRETDNGRQCKSLFNLSRDKDNNTVRTIIGGSNSSSSNVLLNYYDPHQEEGVNCRYKFECPHVQECVNGVCMCPTRNEEGGRGGGGRFERSKKKYNVDMIWNEELKMCLSLQGSYCNNARFSPNSHRDNPLIQGILKSMTEIRCAHPLVCEDSESFEIGFCNSSTSRLLAIFLVPLLLFLLSII